MSGDSDDQDEVAFTVNLVTPWPTWCVLQDAEIQVFDWPAKSDKVRPAVYPTTVMIQGNLDRYRRGYAKIFEHLEASLIGKSSSPRTVRRLDLQEGLISGYHKANGHEWRGHAAFSTGYQTQVGDR
jgi:hypothetical protein